jgi:hypothetical protein
LVLGQKATVTQIDRTAFGDVDRRVALLIGFQPSAGNTVAAASAYARASWPRSALIVAIPEAEPIGSPSPASPASPRLRGYPRGGRAVPAPHRAHLESVSQLSTDEGIHDEVIPHLTVAVGDGTLQDQVDAALTPNLPIAADAREVVLLEEQRDGHWRKRERFPLGR